MKKRLPIKKILTIGVSTIILLIVFLSFLIWFVQFTTKDLIFAYTDRENIPDMPVAIVFGASVNPNTQLPSDILKDRIITGVDLYNGGKVQKILMSGDNRVTHYNEPVVMKKFAELLNVDTDDIVEDFAGRRTYDTCYRAKEIFGIDKAILVTQEYHLYRAIYTCRALGIDAVGVGANRQPYVEQSYYNLREIMATYVALLDVHLTHPEPILGEKEEIFK